MEIFEKLENNLTKSEKHFKFFRLNNTFIKELKDNTFRDITFDEIFIINCTKLNKIHNNAFSETDLVTKILSIFSNPKLSSTDNSIFEVISKFLSLEYIRLEDNNITEITSNAFQRVEGYQDKLTYMRIGGKSIEKIGSRPFSLLRKLEYLDIYNTSIDYIPEYAFEFEEESNQRMTLRLIDNEFLFSFSFHEYSLTHFKRPINIILGSVENNFEYLDENVFESFLNSNPQNQIEMSNEKLDCNNCVNLWLRKKQNRLERFIHLECSNKMNINDPDNFAECGPAFQVLKPCKFVKNEQAIYCGGNTDIDLKSIFHNFSKQLSNNEKHFKTFYLNNTYIKALEENTFSEITFDEIDIKGCDNLMNIDRYAFSTTDFITKGFWLFSNSKLSMDKTIFDILSSFVNIESIYLSDIGFTEIPSKAFRPLIGYQNNLKNLTFFQEITKIGSHAFFDLKNLSKLSILTRDLISIPDYAFEFEEFSDQLFLIQFVYNSNFSAFNEKTLLNIRRPTQLELYNTNNAYYLEEKVFLPFLLDNEKNTIKLTEVEVFDCNDCRNYWIKNISYVNKRVTANCSNKKLFNDSDNFKNCT